MHIYEKDFEMFQEHGIQRSHAHENVFYDAIARLLHASRDLELVGSHVMSLNPGLSTTTLTNYLTPILCC